MSTYLWLALIAMAVVQAAADPTMPSLPQQYTTDVTEDADGSNTTTIEYWDLVAGRFRQDMGGADPTVIMLAFIYPTYIASYSIITSVPMCTKVNVPRTPTQQPGGGNCSEPKFGGSNQGVDSWTVDCPDDVTTYYWRGNIPVEFDTKSLDSHSTDKTYYSNFVLGAPAASLFAIPSYCNSVRVTSGPAGPHLQRLVRALL